MQFTHFDSVRSRLVGDALHGGCGGLVFGLDRVQPFPFDRVPPLQFIDALFEFKSLGRQLAGTIVMLLELFFTVGDRAGEVAQRGFRPLDLACDLSRVLLGLCKFCTR